MVALLFDNYQSVAAACCQFVILK